MTRLRAMVLAVAALFVVGVELVRPPGWDPVTLGAVLLLSLLLGVVLTLRVLR